MKIMVLQDCGLRSESACRRMTWAELTATVTATAATNGRQRRPATSQKTRTIRGNLGYVRPEKRKVEVPSLEKARR